MIDLYCSTVSNNLDLLDIFINNNAGVYWINVQLVTPRILNAHHTFALIMLRTCDDCSDGDDVVATFQDNREKIDLVQYGDILQALWNNSGLGIFQHFLGDVPITLDAVIYIKHRISDTNTLATASCIDHTLQKRCHTRSLLSLLSTSLHNVALLGVARQQFDNRRARLKARMRATLRISRSNKRWAQATTSQFQTPKLQLSCLKQSCSMKAHKRQFQTPKLKLSCLKSSSPEQGKSSLDSSGSNNSDL